MARAYFQPAVGGDDFQGVLQVVEVGERFPHAHEDEVVDPFSGDGFRREDLPDDFPGREVAFEAQQSRRRLNFAARRSPPGKRRG